MKDIVNFREIACMLHNGTRLSEVLVLVLTEEVITEHVTLITIVCLWVQQMTDLYLQVQEQ